MSLYYEAAAILDAPNNAGGSLKSRIFSKKDFKSQPAQIYAIVIETCKWSSVLKEVIEKTNLLTLERKLTPVLSLLLVHDLLLAKRGIALPATHGLRASVERHKARLTAEFTRARVRRQLGTLAAFTEHIESGAETSSSGGAPAPLAHPRWIRINALKTSLAEQLASTFADYERVASVTEVQRRGPKKLFLDPHVPDLVAIPPNVDLTKSAAYTSGALIFQDKASCFPAYLLDPQPTDGDVIDTCAAPGNKTTHLAAILSSHSGPAADSSAGDASPQTIHAFEKDGLRAKTLAKMVALAGATPVTTIHASADFLKANPASPQFAAVGALLLDPSCSGSGIVGRDDMPALHVPAAKSAPAAAAAGGKGSKKGKGGKAAEKTKEPESLKRKRGDEGKAEAAVEVLVDDDGVPTAIASAAELQARLAALAAFQTSLVEHAMSFPAARKITYSTCSVHFAENEGVVVAALGSAVAVRRGWRVLRREEQVSGMREWGVRGERGVGGEVAGEVAEGCVRAVQGDGGGTMGFFVCGFVREGEGEGEEKEGEKKDVAMAEEEKEEWGGFGDAEAAPQDVVEKLPVETPAVAVVAAVAAVAKEGEGAAGPAKKKRKQKGKKAAAK